MINKTSLLFTLLFACSLLSNGQGTFKTRNEYRSNCNGSEKTLTTVEEYNSDGKIISSIHKKNNRKTVFKYDASGNCISKIHSDSTGKTIRYNVIYYNENNEYTTDTLFNGNGSPAMVFRRRHSKKPNEDIVTWDNLQLKGSTIIQTIKLDDKKNEIENDVCTSSAECSQVKNTYSGKNKVKTEVYRTEEMNRKPVLTETQIYEYDSHDRLTKVTYTNEVDKACSQILTYTYE